MTSFSAFSYLSLLKWCREVASPEALVEAHNGVYIHRRSYYDHFGPPDVFLSSDRANVEEYGGAEDHVSTFTTVTRQYHAAVGDMFLAALDNVRIQRMSLGRERFHLFLDDGIAAAESYNCARIAETLSDIIKEKAILPLQAGPLTVNVAQDFSEDGRVDVPCVLISHMWMHNYAHWLFEVLPRLWYLEAVPQLANLPIVVPRYPADSFQEQTLAAVLSNRPRIWPFGNVVRFRRLFFPSFIAPGCYSRHQIDWINRTLRDGLGVAPSTESKRRIYISRADAKARRVSNEAELIALLGERGFTPHVLGGLSVRQQIELFSEAETIIVPHGANCANLVFAPPGVRVVELVPTSSVHPMYWMISKLAGHLYGRLLCPDQGRDQEMFVDKRLLTAILDELDRLAERG